MRHHVFTATGLYLLGVCVAPLLSSHRMVRVFGIAATLSLAGAYALYSTWFISVWCFFAALLSVIVLLHFAPRAQPAHEAAPCLTRGLADCLQPVPATKPTVQPLPKKAGATSFH